MTFYQGRVYVEADTPEAAHDAVRAKYEAQGIELETVTVERRREGVWHYVAGVVG